jgi:hypothetical protein
MCWIRYTPIATSVYVALGETAFRTATWLWPAAAMAASSRSASAASDGWRVNRKRVRAARPEGGSALLRQDKLDMVGMADERTHRVAVAGKVLVRAFKIEQVFEERRFRAAPGAPAGDVQDVERIVR